MNPDTFMLPISFVIGVSVHHGYSGKAGAITIARLRSVRQGRQCLELEVDRKVIALLRARSALIVILL
jgi:hypothetical protein